MSHSIAALEHMSGMLAMKHGIVVPLFCPALPHSIRDAAIGLYELRRSLEWRFKSDFCSPHGFYYSVKQLMELSSSDEDAALLRQLEQAHKNLPILCGEKIPTLPLEDQVAIKKAALTLLESDLSMHIGNGVRGALAKLSEEADESKGDYQAMKNQFLDFHHRLATLDNCSTIEFASRGHLAKTATLSKHVLLFTLEIQVYEMLTGGNGLED